MIDINELENLERLKEKKLITSEEYEKLRDDIVNGKKGKSQTVYCLLALFLGALGIHNFYIGRWKRGLTQLLMTVLSPLTFFLTYFISAFWSTINIFAIHTDGQEKEFIKNDTAKIICGLFSIFFSLILVFGIVSGGIAGYTVAMNRYRANQILDIASKTAIIAQDIHNGAGGIVCTTSATTCTNTNATNTTLPWVTTSGIAEFTAFPNNASRTVYVQLNQPPTGGVVSAIRSIIGSSRSFQYNAEGTAFTIRID